MMLHNHFDNIPSTEVVIAVAVTSYSILVDKDAQEAPVNVEFFIIHIS
jgi:hypothetical protein